MSREIEITFIINGENCPIKIDEYFSLHTATLLGLDESRNTGRPVDDWNVRDAKGTYLDKKKKLEEYKFPDSVRLFVSLEVGCGGNRIAA